MTREYGVHPRLLLLYCPRGTLGDGWVDLTWTIVPPPQYNNNRRAQYNNTWTIVPSRWTASRKPSADF